MTLGNAIRSGTKWLIAGSLSGQVLQFAFGIVLARILVPADFGMLVTIQIFTGIAGLFASGGLGLALVQAEEVGERDFNSVFTTQLAIGACIFAFFFLTAHQFATWYKQPIYADLMRLSAVSFLLRPFAMNAMSRLHRSMSFQRMSIIGLCTLVGTSVTSIALALRGLGVWSLVIAGLIGACINIALLLWSTRWVPRLVLDRDAVRRLAMYGAMSTANDFFTYLRSQASNFTISHLSTPATVGLFNKADSLAKMPFESISGSVYQPVFRALSKVQGDLNQSQYIYLRTISLLAVYTLPLYIGIAWTARPLIEVVYGPKWLDASTPLTVLAGAGGLWCLIHPAGAVLAARKWLHREVTVQVTWAALTAGGCYFGMAFGLKGVAIAVVAAQIYCAAHMTWLATRCLNISMARALAAFGPGLGLSAILLGALIAIEYAVAMSSNGLHPAAYLLLVSSVGAPVYLAAFLTLPFPSIAEEVVRWRGLLRRVVKR